MWLNIGAANRYYNNLTDAQKKKFKEELNKKHEYRTPTNNCSSFASDTVEEVIGEDVDADDEDLLGIETPEELMENILQKEVNNQTTNEGGKK